MKKLSVVRGNGVENCPYGLPTIDACKSIGNVIFQLQPLVTLQEQDKKKRFNDNNIVYLTQKTGQKCPFANEILNNFNKVDCSYGDVAAGDGAAYLAPSPFYPRNTIGDGLTMGPDNKQQNITEPGLTYNGPEKGLNVPFGLFSIFSNKLNEGRLIKLSTKYTNKIVNIKDKLALLRDSYFDTLKSVMPCGPILELKEEHLEKLLFVINDWVK